MHDAIGADVADAVKVEIERAGREPEIRVPMDLRKALAGAPLARQGWEDIVKLRVKVCIPVYYFACLCAAAISMDRCNSEWVTTM